jgi:hypothetical protein
VDKTSLSRCDGGRFSADRQATVRLTSEIQQHLSGETLLREVKLEFDEQGGYMDGGEIVIAEWRE